MVEVRDASDDSINNELDWGKHHSHLHNSF